MAPYKVIIAYDGTGFFGFQRQVDVRTVQGEIEKALRMISWKEKSILFSGRTDTGVHAEGQVISFHLDWNHSEQDMLNGLNSYLPEDISATGIKVAKAHFHPRFDAVQRTYRYQIYHSNYRNCLLDRYHWRVWPRVDILDLENAAEKFIGVYDFKHFGNPPNEKSTTIRMIKKADWERKENGIIHFHITANAFLYHMVRRIIYVLVKTAQKKIDPELIEEALGGRNRIPDGIAPANGLFLEKIEY